MYFTTHSSGAVALLFSIDLCYLFTDINLDYFNGLDCTSTSELSLTNVRKINEQQTQQPVETSASHMAMGCNTSWSMCYSIIFNKTQPEIMHHSEINVYIGVWNGSVLLHIGPASTTRYCYIVGSVSVIYCKGTAWEQGNAVSHGIAIASWSERC